MKTLRLLATLLLVALSMGLYSCSKDDFVDTPPIPVTPDNIFNDTDKKFAEYMDDYSDINFIMALQSRSKEILSTSVNNPIRLNLKLLTCSLQ